jgi:hypothetical protein
MAVGDLVRRRLANQGLVPAGARRPEDVVARLGAVQAQDYPGAKWALACRARGLRDTDVQEAYDAGRILRTHVLRPTWHFVSPADIRWLLALTAPRVRAALASYDRKLELDGDVRRRSRAAIGRALRGGKHRTRAELSGALARAGIRATGQRLAHVMAHAELDALVCSGALRGKQFTYALLEERVPPTRAVSREEALALLAARYFAGHGPATVRDFGWWSGLTAADARAAVALARPALVSAAVDGLTCWMAPAGGTRRTRSPAVYLLSNYDEYFVAYKDRAWTTAASQLRLGPAREFPHQLMIDGHLAGSWRRTIGARAAAVEVRPYRGLGAAELRALRAEAERYARFLERPVTLAAR